MNVLIGSNGGLAGVYLARRLRGMEDVRLFGADSSADCVGRFFVEEQLKLPPAAQPQFIEELILLLDRYGIDRYLPTHSREMAVVSQYEDAIRSRVRTRFLVSPFGTFQALDNKRAANRNLDAIGVPVPALAEDAGCGYPIIMKRDTGSGGSGAVRIENARMHGAYKETYADSSFYQIVEGQEYTLDCMFDGDGGLVGCNQRRRVKTIGGAVTVTANDDSFDVSPWLDRIMGRWAFRGCVNFQYIVSGGRPYFIDVNLRYPSGGLPLTVASGLDVPRLVLDILDGRPAGRFRMAEGHRHLGMYRYFEEIFA